MISCRFNLSWMWIKCGQGCSFRVFPHDVRGGPRVLIEVTIMFSWLCYVKYMLRLFQFGVCDGVCCGCI